MATLLDYLIPQTMEAGRRADLYDQQRALETLNAYAVQPDRFEGVEQTRVPSPDVLAAYTKATGGLPWPKSPVPQTGGPPPGVAGGQPFASMNMPAETLAVMRSPINQTVREMGEKAAGEAMAKIRGRETMLANQGNLPTRELQTQMETLGSVLKPAGFTDTDIGASIAGRYPMASQKELAAARSDGSLNMNELALKAAGGDQEAAKALQLIAQTHRAGLRDAGSSAGGEAKPPAVVKLAQQFMQKFGPYISQQLPPMMQILLATSPNAKELVQAIQSSPIDPSIKQQYLYYSQILDQWTRAQMGAMGITPGAAPAAPAENDPLGIR
jgi:hypothetical protein